MNFNILREFRHGLYQAFRRSRDVLFELCEALLTEVSAHSLPELSLSPFFTRRWHSIYKALRRGAIDRSELRALFCNFIPSPPPGQRLVIGVDATNIVRQYSPTARDRTCLQVHNLPHGQSATTYGWQFSTVVVLPTQPSSQTYLLEQSRITSQTTAGQVAAEQLERLVGLLPGETLLEADRYYGSAKFVKATQKVHLDKLLRIKSDRVFYRVPAPPTGKRGAPAKHGPVFKCKDATTQGVADEVWEGVDESYGPVKVERWRHLHFRSLPLLGVEVIKVTRPKATNKRRDPRVSWFGYVGQTPLALSEVVSFYRRRYSQEHGYRFDKQALLWEEAHLRRVEEFERWSWLLAAVHNQIVLALPLLTSEEVCYAWQNCKKTLTPGQARRGMGRIISKLGSPVERVKGRGKSAGRSVGTVVEPALRYEVVRKGTSKKRPTKKAG